MYSFPNLETVCCSMSSSNCYFLTCIHISQEAVQVVWYSLLFQNFPVYCDPHSQGFGIVNKAEIDVFLEISCFFDDPSDVGNLISGSSAFSKTSLNIWKFTVHVLLKPGLENFEHYFTNKREIRSDKQWQLPLGQRSSVLFAPFHIPVLSPLPGRLLFIPQGPHNCHLL